MEYLVLVIDDDFEDRLFISDAFKTLSPQTKVIAFGEGLGAARYFRKPGSMDSYRRGAAGILNIHAL